MAERILADEITAVKLYLGQELCKTPGATVELEGSPDLTCSFRIHKDNRIVHRLTIWAAVFEDLRGGRETVSKFLDRKGIPATMRAAQDRCVVVRGINDEPEIEGEMPQ